jgi:hypothetical protein
MSSKNDTSKMPKVGKNPAIKSLSAKSDKIDNVKGGRIVTADGGTMSGGTTTTGDNTIQM